ncbi:ADP-ribosylglycohydrolase family protein [Neobacillus sp. OS1-33]|uniref:ADP-ribosylglycohydrolase family protein n=1 Tax=Neobacillus sp. OS1-33 TaxID=3070683 RepID=UPI0035A5DDF5
MVNVLFDQGKPAYVLKVVNLGDDADTTGAIYGQLAGAFYGVSMIPEQWRQQLVQLEFIETLANKLYELQLET